MRIDMHTHAFHDKIAEKAIKHLVNHYKHLAAGTGIKEDLISFLDKARIDKSVVLCAATVPEQVVPANDWAIALSENPRFIPFGTVHPNYPDWEKELERLKKHGIKGIKFHPDFQGFHLDSKIMFPIYEAIAGKFVVTFHIGDVHHPDINPSSPQKFANVLKNFPSLTAIAAHFGGYAHWQWVKESLSKLNFYMDTSSSLKFIPDQLLKEILNTFPEDFFLFGSDYPLGDPVTEIKLLEEKAKFSDAKIERLLQRGAKLLELH
ncbi:MAG: amidohydrolase family protein [Spirochaetaceae bacterium]|nr:amidohydrolase family protein [Spirochaetaceae bacterium]